MVERFAIYSDSRYTIDRICPYCVQEREAAELIVKSYPHVYEITRHGPYYNLKLVPQLELFTKGGEKDE